MKPFVIVKTLLENENDTKVLELMSNNETRSQSYQTHFFVKKNFPLFVVKLYCIIAYENIVCTRKWPSLKVKIRKTKKSKFGWIDSRAAI